ncbi:MAG: hypothetical protein ABIG61_15250 [Planctomycetota bacterium]
MYVLESRRYPLKFYIGRFNRGDLSWLYGVTPDLTSEGIREAIRTGPYGRCVYGCDNNVADHQVVNMLFEGGQTASFTVTAFTEHWGRKTRIFGTHGQIYGDSSRIEHFDFLSDQTKNYDVSILDDSIAGAHGGGDYRLADAFIQAVATGDTAGIMSGPQETLETHLMVFAAEQARLESKVVELDRPESQINTNTDSEVYK